MKVAIDRRKYAAASQLTRALVRAPRRILALCLLLAFLILSLGIYAGLHLAIDRYIERQRAKFSSVHDGIATIADTSRDSLLRARLAIEAVIGSGSLQPLRPAAEPARLGQGAYFVDSDNLALSPTVYLLSDSKDIEDRNTPLPLPASSYISLLRYNNRVFAKYIEHSYVLTADCRLLSVQPAFSVMLAAGKSGISQISQFIQPICDQVSRNLQRLPITTLRNDTFWSGAYSDPMLGQPAVLNAVVVFRGGEMRLVNAHAIPLSQFPLPAAKDGRFGVFMRDGSAVISNNPLDSAENKQHRQLLQQAIPSWPEARQLAIHRVGNLLTLSQTVGNTQWTLVSLITIGELLSALSAMLLLYGVLWLLCGAGLVTLYFLIDRRLFKPAERQSTELVEARRFAEALINAAPIGLCVFARDGLSMLIQNHTATEMLGAERVGALGPLQRQLFAAHADAHQVEVAGARLLRAELSLEMAAGSKFLSAYYAPSQLRNQDVQICVFVDISERKQTELSWERAREATESAQQAKSAFLASVSHELRTPLHGMLGGIELLSRMELPPVSREYVSSVWDSAQNLLLIINSVLDFSKIEADKIEIFKRPGSIRAVAQRVAKLHAIVAEKKGIQLFLHVDPAIPEYLLFENVRVEQILSNLCNNAVKFTDQGRIQIRLELDSEDGEQLLLRGQVIDSGVGISQRDQSKLFQPFFQGNHTQLRQGGGTGLGLAICKRLLILMGGDITVFSDPGLGSCFSFTLPVQRDHSRVDFLDLLHAPLRERLLYGVFGQREISASVIDICRHFDGIVTVIRPEMLPTYSLPPQALLITDMQDEKLLGLAPDTGIISIARYLSLPAAILPLQQRVSSLAPREITLSILEACGAIKSGHVAPEAERSAGGIRPHRGLRVLLAEDHPVNLHILTEQLQSLGCTVIVALNGREALMQLKDREVDVVVTDINMPLMDGLELTRCLRLQAPQLPIIGITSSVDRELLWIAMEIGMDLCITKPLTLQHLDEALNTVREKCRGGSAEPAAGEQYRASAPHGGEMSRHGNQTVHQIYLSNYRHDIALLTTALAQASVDSVRDRLHRIEGVLGFLGADASHALSGRIRAELKSSATVSQKVRDDCDALIAAMEELAQGYGQEDVGAAAGA
ncbi:ATP-binding protein [Paraherbaspirillum soli]|uniref:histidine kinase n=1 Tax=Paraherbaspirillum soli TaxID=631222 RepID=A0ABW0M4G1_9BURK